MWTAAACRRLMTRGRAGVIQSEGKPSHSKAQASLRSSDMRHVCGLTKAHAHAGGTGLGFLVEASWSWTFSRADWMRRE
jgi:predicted trehalose synthase